MTEPLPKDALLSRLAELEAAELDVANSVDFPAQQTANWKYAETARLAAAEITRLRNRLRAVEIANYGHSDEAQS